MKKLFTLLSLVAMTSAALAQTYFDDFDSYNPGDYMGVVNSNWTTWSNAPGGSEDVQVNDAQAYSGLNSIYIHSNTPGGGPQDAILSIGNNLSDGVLTIGSQMYITSGKVGYFNLQATPNPGVTWTLNFQAQNGELIVDEDGVIKASASYNDDEWFEWEIVANMTLNIWKFYLNGNLVSTFSSGSNQVSSMDIFGIEDADFWIDDIHYNWEEFSLPENNLSALGLKNIGALAGLEYFPVASIRNNGLNEITSFDVTIDDNNGGVYTQTFSDMNLASGEYMDIPFTNAVVPDEGPQNITLSVSNVNGGAADDYADDDIYVYQANFLQPASGKRAVVEEGTGTWCQFCPRGAVTMARMSQVYGDNYTGIAVHNQDPMAVPEYDAGLGLQAFPGGRVDRGPAVSDGDFEAKWLQRMTVAPKGLVSVGAQFDEETRLLQVVMEVECVASSSGVFKPGLVIVEDGVTGTGSGYAQSNAFSGQDVEMGGYEDLPNPVPASMMVYDHVGRSILPDYNGAEDVIPGNIVEGQTYAVNFEMTIPDNWNVDELSLVGLFYKGSNIDNSFGLSLQDAIAEGWYDTGVLVSVFDRMPEPDATVNLYPNPASNHTFIDLNLKSADKVSVVIQSVEGKIISQKEYGTLSGVNRLPVNTTGYAQGLYLVQVKIGHAQTVKKLFVD